MEMILTRSSKKSHVRQVFSPLAPNQIQNPLLGFLRSLIELRMVRDLPLLGIYCSLYEEVSKSSGEYLFAVYFSRSETTEHGALEVIAQSLWDSQLSYQFGLYSNLFLS